MTSHELSFASAFPWLVSEANPTIPSGTLLTAANDVLAAELGLPPEELCDLGQLIGNTRPVAMAYSGFQFGQLSPVLGDGRAHLVREIPMQSQPRVPAVNYECAEGKVSPTLSSWPRVPTQLVDLHLKGSGRTSFSRPGSDGKAPLSAAYREFIIAEALHGLGIAASRTLAVFDTGEKIMRRGPELEKAGIMVRAASSHVRVGTFHYAHLNIGCEERQELVKYCLRRHYPHVQPRDEAPALTLLAEVAKRQALLIAQWMGVGFVHGVLNTDNVTISSEAIDFGPCAFIDAFTRDAVFSSIDERGRYAYSNQPAVTQWNLARFAESLLDLISPEDPDAAIAAASRVLENFADEYRWQYACIFAQKLGIRLEGQQRLGPPAEVCAFIDRTLDLMEANSVDFTRFFRALTERPSELAKLGIAQDEAVDFVRSLDALRRTYGTNSEEARQLMEKANPIYIPRNHHVEAALRAAEHGDLTKLHTLVQAVRHPYQRCSGFEHLESSPAPGRNFVSFCGT